MNNLANILIENRKKNIHEIFCLTEIALINNWISSVQVKKMIKKEKYLLDIDLEYLNILIKNRIV